MIRTHADRRLTAATLVLAVLSATAAGGSECGRSEYVMGTILSVRAWSQTDSVACTALDLAFDRVHELDRLLSNYRPESEVSQLNGAGGQWVTVSEPTERFLAGTWSWVEETGGALNPLVGPLVDLWGFFEQEYQIPDSTQIATLLPLTDPARLERGDASGRYRLPRGAYLDPGATGKGFALLEADRAVLELALDAILYDFGGQIYYRGDTAECHAVRHPRSDTEVVSVLCFKRGSVATSGDYERFFTVDGIRYAHILDPRNGRPVRERAAVSVFAPDPLTADALSTALFVLGPGAGDSLLAGHPAVGALFMEWKADTLVARIRGNWPTLETR